MPRSSEDAMGLGRDRDTTGRFHVKQTAPRALEFLIHSLHALEAEHLLRTRPSPPLKGVVSFCSNDYLGLADRHVSGLSGCGASRLVAGERDSHKALETTVAQWLGMDSALAFSSGYAANVGLLSALVGRDDTIVSDALNHASIIDGARLSRGNIVVVPHLDTVAVEQALARPREGRAWVVTESYFSMDADSPDVGTLRRLCDRAGAALVIDEAHALGVLGPGGRGVCAEAGVVPDVLIGTFGKAFGASGAFVAGCEPLTAWLWNRARSFVFSTGISPVVADAAREGVITARDQEDLRAHVLALTQRLRSGLQTRGVHPIGYGHVVPWVLGQSEAALAMAQSLQSFGFHAQAIRPPTVPQGTARIRLTVTASHRNDDIDRLLDTIALCTV